MRRVESIRTKAHRQEGFGLIELLASMVVLSIAVAALLTAFTSSTRSLGRAGERGTATTLVESQLELYRKLAWDEICIDASQLSVAPASYLTPNPSDSWFPTSPSPQVECATGGTLPVQGKVTGADNHSYRIDTYIKYEESADGTPITTLKRVWVVVYRVNGDDSPPSRLTRASSSYASFNYTIA